MLTLKRLRYLRSEIRAKAIGGILGALVGLAGMAYVTWAVVSRTGTSYSMACFAGLGGLLLFVLGLVTLVYEVRTTLDVDAIAPLGGYAQREAFRKILNDTLDDFLQAKKAGRGDRRLFRRYMYEALGVSGVRVFVGMSPAKIRPLLEGGEDQPLRAALTRRLETVWELFLRDKAGV